MKMKKAASILSAMIILLSGLRVTVATHFCGGSYAASKVSLSGKLASCGMEDDERDRQLPWDQYRKHCCDNEVMLAGTDNIFTDPVPCDIISLKEFADNIFFIKDYRSCHLYEVRPENSVYYPPGLTVTNPVSQETICVFRI
jgi:hypothetical protein